MKYYIRSGKASASKRVGTCMIYLELFLAFLQIGALSFGGGYAATFVGTQTAGILGGLAATAGCILPSCSHPPCLALRRLALRSEIRYTICNSCESAL